MVDAQRTLREQQISAQAAGFHNQANWMQARMEQDTTHMANAAEAIMNLATATVGDRQVVDSLTATIANLTAQLQQKDTLIATLQQQVASNREGGGRGSGARGGGRGGGRGRGGATTTTTTTTDATPRTLYYCWSHGYSYNPAHRSDNCTDKKAHHKVDATVTANMGGEQYRRPRGHITTS